MEDTPVSIEKSFIEFEENAQKVLDEERKVDFDRNSYFNGEYSGSYAPERRYVSTMLGVMDALELDIEVFDICNLENHVFEHEFMVFENTINRVKTQFLVRELRLKSGSAGTLISLPMECKEEISGYIEKIRKVLNQTDVEKDKKDLIFKRLNQLQSEIDRDRTTVDAVFSKIIKASKVVREVGVNAKPMVDVLERITNLITENASPLKQITQQAKKLLTDNRSTQSESEETTESAFSDDIPF